MDRPKCHTLSMDDDDMVVMMMEKMEKKEMEKKNNKIALRICGHCTSPSIQLIPTPPP